MTWNRAVLSLPLLLACESVANLDEVNIASGGQGGTTQDAAPETADATNDGDANATDASDGKSDVEYPDSGYSFPASCVKPGSVLTQCDPRTNAGCGADTACDMAQKDAEYAFVCFPTGAVDEGQPCNGVSGPWCKATLHCGTDKCVKFCCTSADCPGSSCSMYDPIKVGTFGWCK